MPSRAIPFSVLFYNCHLFGDTVTTGLIAAFQKLTGGLPLTFCETERADRIASAILALAVDHRLDAVGLCEVWDDGLAARLAARLQGVLNYHYRPVMKRLGGQDTPVFGSGLLVLTRKPHTKVGLRAFPTQRACGFDKYAQKGYLRIAFESPPGRFRLMLICTHLQSGNTPQAGTVRSEQIAQLQRTIDASRRHPRFKDFPVLLLGDLNIMGDQSLNRYATGEYVETLQTLGMKDAYRVVHPNARASPGFTSDPNANRLIRYFHGQTDLSRRLDYVLWNDPCDCVKLKSCEIETLRAVPPMSEEPGSPPALRHLSDHFAIRAAFELRAV